MKSIRIALASLVFLAACGDDATTTTDTGVDRDSATGMDATPDTGGGSDATPDGTGGDAMPDGSGDASGDGAPADGMVDATPADGSMDATPADGSADATADGAADATPDAVADATTDIGLPDAVPGCRSDGDCGAPACRNMGRNCVQTTPGCVGGACVSRTITVRGGRCDASSGICSGGTVSCTTLCDCPQGLICPDGMCLAGIVAEYCCTNPGCPSGTRCRNADGSPGTCP